MSMVSVFVKEGLPSKEVDWSEENQKHLLPVNINILSYPRASSSSTVLTAFLYQYSGTSVVLVLLLPPWFLIFDRCSPLFIFAGWICWICAPLFICAGWICWWSRRWQIDPPRMSAWSVIDRRLIREQSFNVNSTPSHLQHCPGKPSNSNRKPTKYWNVFLFLSLIQATKTSKQKPCPRHNRP